MRSNIGLGRSVIAFLPPFLTQAKALCDALRHVKDVRRVLQRLSMPPPCISLNAGEWLQLHHTTQALLHMREVLQVALGDPSSSWVS